MCDDPPPHSGHTLLLVLVNVCTLLLPQPNLPPATLVQPVQGEPSLQCWGGASTGPDTPPSCCPQQTHCQWAAASLPHCHQHIHLQTHHTLSYITHMPYVTWQTSSHFTCLQKDVLCGTRGCWLKPGSSCRLTGPRAAEFNSLLSRLLKAYYTAGNAKSCKLSCQPSKASDANIAKATRGGTQSGDSKV